MADGEERTDVELLEGWSNGDNTAGSKLYQRHFGPIHRYFANKIGSDRDLEDLIQQTFATCLERHDSYRREAPFRSWAIGIANNLLRQHYRSRHRRVQPIDFEEATVRDLCPGPSTLLNHARDQQALLDALRAIPFDAQVTLELYYWERLTGEELGELLGITEAGARNRILRAKQRLLEALRRNPLAERTATDENDLDAWALQVRKAAFPEA